MAREYINVASFYVKDHAEFTIGAYSDDKIEVLVSKTVFTVYRGHPYVVVKHSNDDLYFTTSWNKVFADSVNDVSDDYPVLWDLLNHENLLSECVGGINLKASCLDISSVDNDDIGTFPNLVLTQVTQEPIYDRDNVFFSVEGSVTDVDEEIPMDGVYNGAFGEYSVECVVDNKTPKSITLSGDSKIIQTNDNDVLRAKVTDYEFKGVPNTLVYFFEQFNPVMVLSSDKSIIQSGESANLSVNVKDEDGSIVKGSVVHFYQVIDN